MPEDRIAVHPLEERSSSKMLVVNNDVYFDSVTKHLPDWLSAGDVLLLNNTKVLQARVPANRLSGGKVEVLFLNQMPDERDVVSALVKPSRKLKVGEVLRVSDVGTITLVDYKGEGVWLVQSSVNPSEMMQRADLYHFHTYEERTR